LHGISLLYENDLFPYVKKITNSKSKCVLWVVFGFSNTDFALIVGSVYIPGYNSKFSDSNDFDIISEDLISLTNKYMCPFVMLGDYNSRTGKLCDFYNASENFSNTETKINTASLGIITDRFNCDKKVDTHGRKLIRMCRDFNLNIVNGRFGSDERLGQFTCIKPTGRSVVDYALVSNHLLPSISNFYVDVFDPCMSDVHVPICLDLKITQASNIKQKSQTGKQWEKIKFKSNWKPESKNEFINSFDQNDIMQLSEKILNRHISSELSQEKMDELVADLNSIILEPAKKVGLCKKVKNTNKKPRENPQHPWFDTDCEKSRKTFFEAKNDIWNAKNPGEKMRCQTIMKQKGKGYKLLISKTQKTYTRELHKNLRLLKRHHPKEYWKILKSAEGSQKKSPKVSMEDCEKHFKNLNTKNSESNIPDFDPRNIDIDANQDWNRDFTFEEIMKNIKDLKNNKSEGVDYIKNEYIKNCPINVVKLLVTLFNLILKTGCVPLEWCIGLIVPIFKKKGSPKDANNYRGITLLSCVGKLFTVGINCRLTKYLEQGAIIGEEQAGFREGYSSSDHIFVLNEVINLYLQDKKKLYCCFIDYQKAFDTINRAALWGKLISNSVNGRFLKVIYNMYQNAKSCVKQETMVSGIFACNVGVRQGENLSPLLFSIFLNDFQFSLSQKYNGLPSINEYINLLPIGEIEFFINMYVMLYADDTLVLAETPQQLQLAMSEIAVYCDQWELDINVTKTKVVIFSKGKIKKQHNFTIGNLKIDTIFEYCYLGIVFNYNGSFTKAITERITLAQKGMFGLNAKAVNLQLPPDIHIDLFEKMITPICLYGSEVWGYSNLEPVEVFYRKFIKRILGLNKSTPNCIVYGEVGKRPLKNTIILKMLNFWIKVSEGKSSKLSSMIYNLIYKLHQHRIYDSPWLMCIKRIVLCYSDNNPDFWYQQQNFVPKVFMKNIVSRELENQFLQEWSFEVYRNRKCVIYRNIKDTPSLEHYLSKLNFIERRILCRFRTGNHKLPITESRYVAGGRGVDVTQCKLCKLSDLCDEYHVLFVCKFFVEQRKKYLKKYFYNRPNTLKMHALFNSNPKQLSQLVKFIKLILSNF
tara:strand:- start:271 stop:3555 length:3285 start_codon:yes stop_codon:yes gene_type:complete